MELGYTLVTFVLMGVLFYWQWRIQKMPPDWPWAKWTSWPTWAQALSIIGPVLLFVLGGVFERSRKWPKV